MKVCCRLLGVSSPGYYQYKHRPLSPTQMRRQWLTGLIHEVHVRVNRSYSSPMSHPQSGDPTALFWPGRISESRILDFGRVLDDGSFRRNYFRPALRALKMRELRVHDLRHTAASLWLAAGYKP